MTPYLTGLLGTPINWRGATCISADKIEIKFTGIKHANSNKVPKVSMEYHLSGRNFFSEPSANEKKTGLDQYPTST